jgi:hypothetical protein
MAAMRTYMVIITSVRVSAAVIRKTARCSKFLRNTNFNMILTRKKFSVLLCLSLLCDCCFIFSPISLSMWALHFRRDAWSCSHLSPHLTLRMCVRACVHIGHGTRGVVVTSWSCIRGRATVAGPVMKYSADRVDLQRRMDKCACPDAD